MTEKLTPKLEPLILEAWKIIQEQDPKYGTFVFGCVHENGSMVAGNIDSPLSIPCLMAMAERIADDEETPMTDAREVLQMTLDQYDEAAEVDVDLSCSEITMASAIVQLQLRDAAKAEAETPP